MRNSLCILMFGLAVTTAPPMSAQEKDQGGQASRVELYGGYNYVRFNINASASSLQPPSQTFNAMVRISPYFKSRSMGGTLLKNTTSRRSSIFPTFVEPSGL